jgi:hypothetical protein
VRVHGSLLALSVGVCSDSRYHCLGRGLRTGDLHGLLHLHLRHRAAHLPRGGLPSLESSGTLLD